MNNIQLTSFVNNSGQLIIPEEILQKLKWISPDAAINVIIEKNDEIRITPHKRAQDVDWDKIWKGIKQSRSIKGKGNMSASEILEKDRQSH